DPSIFKLLLQALQNNEDRPIHPLYLEKLDAQIQMSFYQKGPMLQRELRGSTTTIVNIHCERRVAPRRSMR
ncbi:hypothetical protein L9F63_025076, partial [Diploptera punctata]